MSRRFAVTVPLVFVLAGLVGASSGRWQSQAPAVPRAGAPCGHDPRSGRIGFPAARLLRRVEPDLRKVSRPYPTGVVILEAGIDETGKVKTVCVLRGLRDDVNQATIAAVRRWQFDPAHTREGQPWPVVMTLAVLIRQEPG